MSIKLDRFVCPLALAISMTGSAWADEPHEPIAPTALPEPPPPSPTLPLTPPTTQPPPVQALAPYPHYNVQAAGVQQPATTVSWYGWQSLIGVVPTHLMAAGGLFGGGLWLFIPTIIGGVFTTPIVHGVNGNTGRMYLSFGGNVLAPLAGWAIGSAVDSHSWLPILGPWLAAGLWQATDIAFLHYKEKPAARPRKVAGIEIPMFSVAPMMENGRKGIWIMGQF